MKVADYIEKIFFCGTMEEIEKLLNEADLDEDVTPDEYFDLCERAYEHGEDKNLK